MPMRLDPTGYILTVVLTVVAVLIGLLSLWVEAVQ